MRGATLILFAALGCSRPTLEQAVAAHESVPVVPKPPEKHAEILLRIDRDLDGDVVTLDTDGVLRAGTAWTRIELARNEFFFPLPSSLTSVVVQPGVHAILFSEPTDDGEDPPNRYRLFRKENGKLEVVMDRVIGTYGVTPLTFTGLGTATYIEDGWTACERAKFPPLAEVHEVTLHFDASLEWTGTTRAATKKRQNCKELAG
jgi:hypothetical protein